MKLIVGLGNPGTNYNNTRHNLGFMIVDYFLKKHNLILDKFKFSGYYTIVNSEKEKYVIAKPHTYMNLSGEFIAKISSYFKIDVKDILIISDDKDQNIGEFKLKNSGSAGGHNGLKSIILNLNSSDFNRFKIGIGPFRKEYNLVNYVLNSFSKAELEILKNNFYLYFNIIEDYLKFDFKELQQKYNGKNFKK
ncbi:/ pth / Peptidyl-tRNA hydrolase /:18319 Forward [Candidatus Hepatoplasma crinochetorum]|uniref:Peptidyl-tRNA hydrolase n=1 Tax=Candidatus Hepatoplasma crinochetorum TaxID=295596 RepID=A0A0G7ZNI3_9MOLU|nr:/ pth / Peptidyl-tRNA hydrolase /:18319 Forward [Candidatus Hepatoplasma crinochetorum]